MILRSVVKILLILSINTVQHKNFVSCSCEDLPLQFCLFKSNVDTVGQDLCPAQRTSKKIRTNSPTHDSEPVPTQLTVSKSSPDTSTNGSASAQQTEPMRTTSAFRRVELTVTPDTADIAASRSQTANNSTLRKSSREIEIEIVLPAKKPKSLCGSKIGWSCLQCTFNNKTKARKCKMCNTPMTKHTVCDEQAGEIHSFSQFPSPTPLPIRAETGCIQHEPPAAVGAVSAPVASLATNQSAGSEAKNATHTPAKKPNSTYGPSPEHKLPLSTPLASPPLVDHSDLPGSIDTATRSPFLLKCEAAKLVAITTNLPEISPNVVIPTILPKTISLIPNDRTPNRKLSLSIDCDRNSLSAPQTPLPGELHEKSPIRPPNQPSSGVMRSTQAAPTSAHIAAPTSAEEEPEDVTELEAAVSPITSTGVQTTNTSSALRDDETASQEVDLTSRLLAFFELSCCTPLTAAEVCSLTQLPDLPTVLHTLQALAKSRQLCTASFSGESARMSWPVPLTSAACVELWPGANNPSPSPSAPRPRPPSPPILPLLECSTQTSPGPVSAQPVANTTAVLTPALATNLQTDRRRTPKTSTAKHLSNNSNHLTKGRTSAALRARLRSRTMATAGAALPKHTTTSSQTQNSLLETPPLPASQTSLGSAFPWSVSPSQPAATPIKPKAPAVDVAAATPSTPGAVPRVPPFLGSSRSRQLVGSTPASGGPRANTHAMRTPAAASARPGRRDRWDGAAFMSEARLQPRQHEGMPAPLSPLSPFRVRNARKDGVDPPAASPSVSVSIDSVSRRIHPSVSAPSPALRRVDFRQCRTRDSDIPSPNPSPFLSNPPAAQPCPGAFSSARHAQEPLNLIAVASQLIAPIRASAGSVGSVGSASVARATTPTTNTASVTTSLPSEPSMGEGSVFPPAGCSTLSAEQRQRMEAKKREALAKLPPHLRMEANKREALLKLSQRNTARQSTPSQKSDPAPSLHLPQPANAQKSRSALLEEILAPLHSRLEPEPVSPEQSEAEAAAGLDAELAQLGWPACACSAYLWPVQWPSAIDLSACCDVCLVY
jgi:hypothetical protein